MVYLEISLETGLMMEIIFGFLCQYQINLNEEDMVYIE